MTPKALIKSFFQSDLANDPALIEQFYHKDCLIYWNSSKGLSERNFEDISNFFKGVRESYDDLRFDVTHLLRDDQTVTARYTLYANTIESSAEEIPIAHYICIFHLKDNKIHRAYEISQPADKDTIDSEAYSEIKL